MSAAHRKGRTVLAVRRNFLFFSAEPRAAHLQERQARFQEQGRRLATPMSASRPDCSADRAPVLSAFCRQLSMRSGSARRSFRRSWRCASSRCRASEERPLDARLLHFFRSQREIQHARLPGRRPPAAPALPRLLQQTDQLVQIQPVQPDIVNRQESSSPGLMPDFADGVPAEFCSTMTRPGNTETTLPNPFARGGLELLSWSNCCGSKKQDADRAAAACWNHALIEEPARTKPDRRSSVDQRVRRRPAA